MSSKGTSRDTLVGGPCLGGKNHPHCGLHACILLSIDLARQDAIHPEKGPTQGQGVEDSDAVRLPAPPPPSPGAAGWNTDDDLTRHQLCSGLDNAGKTTIVKKIMGEDVDTVSPTLGFIIKTIDYEGYKLNICQSLPCPVPVDE